MWRTVFLQVPRRRHCAPRPPQPQPGMAFPVPSVETAGPRLRGEDSRGTHAHDIAPRVPGRAGCRRAVPRGLAAAVAGYLAASGILPFGRSGRPDRRSGWWPVRDHRHHAPQSRARDAGALRCAGRVRLAERRRSSRGRGRHRGRRGPHRARRLADRRPFIRGVRARPRRDQRRAGARVRVERRRVHVRRTRADLRDRRGRRWRVVRARARWRRLRRPALRCTGRGTRAMALGLGPASGACRRPARADRRQRAGRRPRQHRRGLLRRALRCRRQRHDARPRARTDRQSARRAAPVRRRQRRPRAGGGAGVGFRRAAGAGVEDRTGRDAPVDAHHRGAGQPAPES